MQHKVTAQIGSHPDLNRDWQNRETGRRLRHRLLRRHHGAHQRRLRHQDQGRSGLVPAHGRLSRKSGGGRQISRRLFQTRRPPFRKGNAHLADDGSPAAAALSRGLSLRHPDHLDAPQRGWAKRSRHSRDQRRFRRAHGFRHSVRGPGRRGARRTREWRVHRQPDPRPARTRAISIWFTSARKTTSS